MQLDSLANIIGNNVRKRREAMDLTMNELAHRLNGYRQCALVHGWETGSRCPSAYMLKRLSEVFNCTIDELFRED